MEPETPATDAPILVTGATGFAGGHLALRLRKDGHKVRALVRDGAKVDHLQAAGVELARGDLRQAADVDKAVAGCAKVYHIAAVYRTASHPDSYYEDVNVGGTVNVLEAAQKHGVERTIHCSTIGVHGDVQEFPCTETSPFNPGDIYQETKLAGEMKAQDAFKAGLPGVVFRPAGMYGPGDLRFLKLFRSVNNGRFVMFGSGETFYHLVYADDLIDGILLCGTHPAALGGTFIIAGDRWVSLNEWVGEIAATLGVSPPRLRLPFWTLSAASTACETLCKPFGIEPPLHHRRASFFIKSRAFSTERARTVLGYAPKVTLKEGIRRTADWYVEQGLITRRGKAA